MKAYKGFDHTNEQWPETRCLLPDPLFNLEKAREVELVLFRNRAEYAFSKWREQFTQFPKIYPSHADWEYAPTRAIDYLTEALEFDIVRGVDKDNQFKTHFIPNRNKHLAFINLLRNYAADFDYTPKFKYPAWDLPSHMMREGTEESVALRASIMYRIEAEAVIYELITLNGDGLTNEPFLRRPNDRFKWTKPLWKKKNPLQSSRSSKPLRTELTEEEEKEIPPIESKEWKKAMQAFSKLSDSHKNSIIEAVGFQNDRITKRRKPSRIPSTIGEEEEYNTYDLNHFTTLDPIVNPATGHIRRSTKAANPKLPYDAATAHSRVGSLRNTILGEPNDQDLANFWDEEPPLTSTPRRHHKSTHLEKAVPLSPPYSDISVHSRTFRVPNSPAMSGNNERHYGDRSGNIRSIRTPRQEEADQPRTPRRSHSQRQNPPDPSDDEDDSDSSSSDSTYRGWIPRPNRGPPRRPSGGPPGPPGGPPGGPHRGPPGPPDPNGPPGGFNRGVFGRGPPLPPPPPGHQGGGLFRIPRAFNPTPYHFDPKLKTDDIPEWDGNPGTLLRWIKKVQAIADRSAYCHEQIGLLAPARFKGRADQWYRYLEPGYKQQIQVDWDTLRVAVSRHFLNLHWFNTQCGETVSKSDVSD